ncbi:hypothetical protein Nepgr_019955 [Nepenthes gracilis]|uniref:Embryogenesis-associated protein EMB8 n=1 Tax=Nepenthes gracilis TaxID=150966 RepID=A0AAD3SW49_NEPGR|nr:hypothetical protein Nepgr_019955 [Nepenthes gracilis]
MAFTSHTSVSSPFLPPKILLSPYTPFTDHQFRVWRRRRLKSKLKLAVRNNFDNIFQDFLSHLPHPLNSLSLLPPIAAGIASGLALSISKLNSSRVNSKPRASDVGEWVLYTSPTPFNRFVLLRCPSISFEGSEFLENVNEKLIKEDRHYVRLDSGRIQVRDFDERESERPKLEYQRVCVGTEDGGVISLDWPANLDLSEEHGLDTTLLIIPGTADGSMDEGVRALVCECLKRGLFPVVMNPRGCAGSPLTTARLFTAADSDDICSAIRFLTRARQCSTLMGVGWGYGANMLTKYLAEVGEKTPLTAATCIDNPFDLEEASRTSSYHASVSQKLTRGLIDILKSNKGLFQGRNKGFDVGKALSAESLRDFEKAISMVSYRFNTIEEFYSTSSTRSMVGNVKIPVLFIQNNDGTVPLFSIPRGLIAENPFTNLLLCTSSPSNVNASGRSLISWCQLLTIEWLTAVELGLLKGRHPLLKDVDVTINPAEGFALMDGRPSDMNDRRDSAWSTNRSDSSSGYFSDPVNEIPEESDTIVDIHLGSEHGLHKKWELDEKDSREMNRFVQQTNPIDAVQVDAKPVESDKGQVLQTAEVVMNMLDVTMPGTLKDEEKKKVLTAVSQGETLAKALQDAVPEDVRGKLTQSVTEILQAQGKNVNFDGLLSIGQIANVSSGLKLKIEEQIRKKSDTGNRDKYQHPSDQKRPVNDAGDGPGYNEAGGNKSAGENDAAVWPQEKTLKSLDLSDSQPVISFEDDISAAKKGLNKSQMEHENFESDKARLSEFNENDFETSAMTNSSGPYEKPSGSEEVSIKPDNRYQDGEKGELDIKEENNLSERDGNHQDSSKNPSKTDSPADVDEAVSHLSSGDRLSEKEAAKTKEDEESMQSVPVQNKPTSHSNVSTFSVSQALDALTGLDDSTQMAVNSVFSVIEDMIAQLEEGKEDESVTKKENEIKDDINGSDSETQLTNNEQQLEKPVDGYNLEEVDSLNIISSRGNDSKSSFGSDANGVAGTGKNQMADNLVTGKLRAANAARHATLNNLQFYITTNASAEAFYNECLRKYILSKMQKAKPLDLDATTTLFLDYIPEEGQWKMLEQPESRVGSSDGAATYKGIHRKDLATSRAKAKDLDNVIEPSYVILDSEKQQEPVKEFEPMEKLNEKVAGSGKTVDELRLLVKKIVLDLLKVEVSRRLGAADMESVLMRDMEEVASAVSLAVSSYKERTGHLINSGIDPNLHHPGRSLGNIITEAVYFAVKQTSYLRRVLPVGVIVGSCLASLRKFFNVDVLDESDITGVVDFDQDYIDRVKPMGQLFEEKATQVLSDKSEQSSTPRKQSSRYSGSIELKTVNGDDKEVARLRILNRDTVMVGAVTAALGASALLTHQQDASKGRYISESSSKSLEKKEYLKKDSAKLEEVLTDKHQNIVTSLAEKAMSVAGPVVPMTEDGEVDQERLVAMLAELGQKGGMLKLVGKIALLWGGIRGAMSLTDRLISFLRIADRPLPQRILGFVCMVLVLWSPVVVPLLPSLVQSWASHSSSRIADLACIIGLYSSITILIILWGKRIRGYENPLQQYGLDLASSLKVQEFLTGLVGGIMLVLSIHTINATLGFVSFSWPENLCSSLDVMAKLKAYGQIFILAGQGIMNATCVAFVEELLFRSWLSEEIAIDLGYHPGIILSGLAFSLSQRSLLAIPGLGLLSLFLAGVRNRKQGSLFMPVGLRSGIIASSFVLQMGGFLVYQLNFPRWVTGTHPYQPFSGVFGLLISLLLAIAFYPRRHSLRQKISRIICK